MPRRATSAPTAAFSGPAIRNAAVAPASLLRADCRCGARRAGCARSSRGLEFARARVEMKSVESVVHLRREHPRRMRYLLPAHIWALVRPYGLEPRPGEAGRVRPDAGRPD